MEAIFRTKISWFCLQTCWNWCLYYGRPDVWENLLGDVSLCNIWHLSLSGKSHICADSFAPLIRRFLWPTYLSICLFPYRMAVLASNSNPAYQPHSRHMTQVNKSGYDSLTFMTVNTDLKLCTMSVRLCDESFSVWKHLSLLGSCWTANGGSLKVSVFISHVCGSVTWCAFFFLFFLPIR